MSCKNTLIPFVTEVDCCWDDDRTPCLSAIRPRTIAIRSLRGCEIEIRVWVLRPGLMVFPASEAPTRRKVAGFMAARPAAAVATSIARCSAFNSIRIRSTKFNSTAQLSSARGPLGTECRRPESLRHGSEILSFSQPQDKQLGPRLRRPILNDSMVGQYLYSPWHSIA